MRTRSSHYAAPTCVSGKPILGELLRVTGQLPVYEDWRFVASDLSRCFLLVDILCFRRHTLEEPRQL